MWGERTPLTKLSLKSPFFAGGQWDTRTRCPTVLCWARWWSCGAGAWGAVGSRGMHLGHIFRTSWAEDKGNERDIRCHRTGAAYCTVSLPRTQRKGPTHSQTKMWLEQAYGLWELPRCEVSPAVRRVMYLMNEGQITLPFKIKSGTGNVMGNAFEKEVWKPHPVA